MVIECSAVYIFMYKRKNNKWFELSDRNMENNSEVRVTHGFYSTIHSSTSTTHKLNLCFFSYCSNSVTIVLARVNKHIFVYSIQVIYVDHQGFNCYIQVYPKYTTKTKTMTDIGKSPLFERHRKWWEWWDHIQSIVNVHMKDEIREMLLFILTVCLFLFSHFHFSIFIFFSFSFFSFTSSYLIERTFGCTVHIDWH